VARVSDGAILLEVPYESGSALTITGMAVGTDGDTLTTCAVFQRDAGYDDSTVCHWWSLKNAQLLKTIARDNTYPWRSAVSSDGLTVAISGSGGLDLVELGFEEERRLIATQEDLGGWRGGLVFSPDASLLYEWAPDGTVVIWELLTGQAAWRTTKGREVVERGETLSGKKEAKLESRSTYESDVMAFCVSPDGRLVATSERPALSSVPGDGELSSPAIRILDARTLAEVQKLEGFDYAPSAMAFSPDGRRLASWSYDGTILLWEMTERPTISRVRMSREYLESLWRDLGSPNATIGYCAMKALDAGREETLRFLEGRLRSVSSREVESVHELVRALDADNFEERERATTDLKPVALRYSTLLRRLQLKSKSAEARFRIAALVAERTLPNSAETLRMLRAIQILERIGTGQCETLLTVLAAGGREARETVAAKLALKRLRVRGESGSVKGQGNCMLGRPTLLLAPGSEASALAGPF
jgi:hypothetical protein